MALDKFKMKSLKDKFTELSERREEKLVKKEKEIEKEVKKKKK